MLLLALVHPALAQPDGVDEKAGRKHAIAAMGAYKQGDYETALRSFEKARKVYPTGQVLRMTGYTLLALEHWREAANTLDEALTTDYKPLNEADGQDARQQRKQARSHLALVTIKSEVDEANLSVDEATPRTLPVTINLDPGEHSFVVSAAGHDDAYRTESVDAGQELSFTIDPKLARPERVAPVAPTPERAPPPEEEGGFGWFAGQGTVGLITAGVGLVAGVIGVGALIYGSSLRSAVQDNIDVHQSTYDAGCHNYPQLCRDDLALINQDGERAQTWQNLGIAMSITGGALLAVGTTLFLLSDDSPFAPDPGDSESARLHCLPALGTGSAELATVGFGCVGSF